MHDVEVFARDIMTTRLVTLLPNEHVLDGIDRLLQHEISGAPVVDNTGTYLGVFSEKSSMMAFSFVDEERSQRCDKSFHHYRARDVMQTELITIGPDTEVFEAISLLLHHHVSGLPVIDAAGAFLGVFSERSAMRVLIDLTWNQFSSAAVSAWMDRDRARTVPEHTSLEEIRRRFSETLYRRLPVLNRGRLVGQISRRDVLRAELDRMVESYGNSSGILNVDEISGSRAPRPEWDVRSFMDSSAQTTREDVDVMSIAQDFFVTSARRFPVLREGRLVGQVSRRDLLGAVSRLFPNRPSVQRPLYLSSTAADVTSIIG